MNTSPSSFCSALEGKHFLPAPRGAPASGAVVPREPDGRHVPSGWELVAHIEAADKFLLHSDRWSSLPPPMGLELSHAEDVSKL